MNDINWTNATDLEILIKFDKNKTISILGIDDYYHKDNQVLKEVKSDTNTDVNFYLAHNINSFPKDFNKNKPTIFFSGHSHGNELIGFLGEAYTHVALEKRRKENVQYQKFYIMPNFLSISSRGFGSHNFKIVPNKFYKPMESDIYTLKGNNNYAFLSTKQIKIKNIEIKKTNNQYIK